MSDHEALFDELGLPSDDELEALHEVLVDRAEADGLLDVAYRIVDSPLGELLLAATPRGLVRVAFSDEGFDLVLAQLVERISPRILRAPSRLDEAAVQLEEYFSRRRRHFDLAVDLGGASGFRRSVLDHLPVIAYGTTASYGDVASAISHPRAARAVGTACASNPLPVVLPCHRVIRSDGAVGAYLGGPAAKRQLLALEAAA